MKVSDILRVKGGTLYTITPEDALADALKTMADLDIGSLVVMSHGEFVGILLLALMFVMTIVEVILAGACIVRTVMDDFPVTCTPETELDEVRRIMLARHARYLPVMSAKTLMGVISFYDVAKAVVDSQDFENRMLKAYIRDWPVEEAEDSKGG